MYGLYSLDEPHLWSEFRASPLYLDAVTFPDLHLCSVLALDSIIHTHGANISEWTSTFNHPKCAAFLPRFNLFAAYCSAWYVLLHYFLVVCHRRCMRVVSNRAVNVGEPQILDHANVPPGVTFPGLFFFFVTRSTR